MVATKVLINRRAKALSSTSRKQANATVDHGFSHSIVCIMATQSYWSGKRVYWDAAREDIVDEL